MSILTQKTLSKSISFNGIGIHTGSNVNLKIIPASPNTGIIFKRVDLNSKNIIYPNYSNVSDTTLCTTISNEYGVKVSTIEHLMGAFYGVGVDNALVEIDSKEVPIMDGSAKAFVDKIKQVGLKFSDQPIKIIKINKDVKVEDEKKFISISKSNISGDLEFEIKYENQFIGTQKNKIKVFEDDLTDIFDSRTFCLFEDIEKLKEINLGRGGSLDNAIVVKGNKILNEGGLRSKKEFVNHKILDLAGDFMLSGVRVIGRVECIHGGHALTNKFLKKIFSDKSNYNIIESQDTSSNVRKILPLNKRLAVNA